MHALFHIVTAELDGAAVPVGATLSDDRPGLHTLRMTAVNGASGAVVSETLSYTLLGASRFNTAGNTAPELGLPPFTPRPVPRLSLAAALARPAATDTSKGGVKMLLPSVVPSGAAAFPVAVFVDALAGDADAYDVTVWLHVEPVGPEDEPHAVTLHRGAGVAMLPHHPRSEDVAIVLRDGDAAAPRVAVARAWARAPKPAAATVALPTAIPLGSVVAVPAHSLATLQGPCVVRGELRVDAGVTVIAGPAAAIVCVGHGAKVVFDGSADAPVTLQPPAPSTTWAGVVAAQNCSVTMHHTLVTGTGGTAVDVGDAAVTAAVAAAVQREHHASNPALRLLDGASATLTHSALAFGAQGVCAHRAAVVMRRCIVQDMAAGAELQQSDVAVVGSVFAGFPSAAAVAAGRYQDDDNDAMYVHGGHVALVRSTFALAVDDCVDSGTGDGGVVLLVASTVHSCFHEGVALSNNGASPKLAVVRDSVVSNSQQGVEMGFSTRQFLAVVEACSVEANGVAVRYSDAYGWPNDGFLHVHRSRLLFNSRDVLNWHRGTGAAVSGRLLLRDTVLTSDAFTSEFEDACCVMADTEHDSLRALLTERQSAGAGGPLPPPVWGDSSDSGSCTAVDDALRASASGAVTWRAVPLHDGGPLTVFHNVWHVLFPDTPAQQWRSLLLRQWPHESAAWHRHRLTHMRQLPSPPPPPPLPPVQALPVPPPRPTPSWFGDGAARSFTAHAPEQHVLVLWSGVPLDTTSAVVAFVDAHPSLSLDATWLVAPLNGLRTHTPDQHAPSHGASWRFSEPADAVPGAVPPTSATSHVRVAAALSEDWFVAMYGASYYRIFESGSAAAVSMAAHKGSRPFFVLLLTDHHPVYTRRAGKGAVNANMLTLKERVRRWLPSTFQVHASQTAAEGVRDGAFLLGRFAGVCRTVARAITTTGCMRHTFPLHLGGATRAVGVAYQGTVPGDGPGDAGALPVVGVPAAFHTMLATLYRPLFYKTVGRPATDLTDLFGHLEAMVLGTEVAGTGTPAPRMASPMETAMLTALYASKAATMVLDLPDDLVWVLVEVPLAHVLRNALVMRLIGWIEELVPLHTLASPSSSSAGCASPLDIAQLWHLSDGGRAQFRTDIARNPSDPDYLAFLRETREHWHTVEAMAANVSALDRVFITMGRGVEHAMTLTDGNHRAMALALAAWRLTSSPPDVTTHPALSADEACAVHLLHPQCTALVVMGVSSNLDCDRLDAGQQTAQNDRCPPQVRWSFICVCFSLLCCCCC